MQIITPIIDAKYTTIGVIVVNWAFVEDIINSATIYFYHQCGGNTIKAYQDEMPRTQFKRKTQFISDCFNKLPSFDKYRSDGLCKINRVNNLCDERDKIIHSVIIDLTDNFKLIKYSYGPREKKLNIPKVGHLQYSLEDLLNLGKKIQEMVSEIGPFFLTLQRELP